MDLVSLAKDIGIPVLGAILGYLGTARLTQHRLATLEKDFEKFREDLKDTLESLEEAAKKDREALRQELHAKLKELEAEIEELEDTLEKFQRASSHDFARDSELAKFIDDQETQWKNILRTLGQIEGLMERQTLRK